MRVGYLGPAGTYSEEALRASSPAGVEEVPYPTIYDAVMAVHDREVDRAVVPIENSLEGAVAVTLDTLALEATDVRIVAEVVHPIHHCVVAARDLDLADVERVISHPQATAQCRRFLRERLAGAELVVAPSTADAVVSVRDSSEPAVALGSRLAAELYGCRVLAADVEDHPDNVTRFVWLATDADAADPGSKTSLVFWGGGDQSPGWLVHALQ
jgi:prephenate dehydratase